METELVCTAVFWLDKSPPPHLLVQGDVVQTDTGLAGEEVGPVVAVLQHGPAVGRVRGAVARVPRAPEPQRRAGGPQALRAGVVVVQEP